MVKVEEENQRGGALYRAGLKAIQEKHGVTLEKALEIALEDLGASKSDEHVESTKAAYEELKSKQG